MSTFQHIHEIGIVRRVKNMLVGMLIALSVYSIYSDVMFAVRVQASAAEHGGEAQ